MNHYNVLAVSHESRFSDAQMFGMFNVECGPAYLWQVSYARKSRENHEAITKEELERLQRVERAERTRKLATIVANQRILERLDNENGPDICGLIDPPKYIRQ